MIYKKKWKNLWIGMVLISSLASLASTSPVQIDLQGYALNGYDPVAYFTLNKVVMGNSTYNYVYNEVTYLFSSSTHLALFQKDPEKYIPQYGGYCAYGATFGMKIVSDPANFTIVKDKLYLNVTPKIKKRWDKHPERYIKKANKKWSKTREKRVRQ